MIASLQIQLHIPQSQSLKDKRRVIKSLKDRLRQKFNVSVAETADLDKWQASTIEIAMVSNDQIHLETQIEKINEFIERVLAGDGFVTAREVTLL